MTTPEKVEIPKEVHDEVAKMFAEGATLGKIEGYLKYVHDYSTNGAKDVVTFMREELGIEVTGTGTADWGPTVEFLRNKVGVLDKKPLIEGMCKINGKTYATNQHAYNYIAMAQEWASQEMVK